MSPQPKAEANRISTILNMALPEANRFPVNVEVVAREISRQRFPSEPIARIESVNLPGFEGVLVQHSTKKKWKIGYNDKIQSPGRIRFTLAHEFGHYLLHRQRQTSFECSEKDMHDWDAEGQQIETEADTFASYLLMPLDDFRRQIGSAPISIDLLRHCGDRYGVSLMAAALKWIEIATKRAVVVAARDGFVLWARSSKSALRSGAFLAARQKTIEVPSSSCLYDASVIETGQVGAAPARAWFPKEPADMQLTEHVHVSTGSYPYTLGILLLPDAVPRWEQPDDETEEPLDGVLRFRRGG